MRTSKPMPPGAKFFFARIFPLIFLVVGATVAFFGIRSLLHARESSHWPTTQGKIVVSKIKTSQSSGKHSSTTYSAGIEYTFQVDKKTYTGDSVAYGDYGSSNRSHASGIVAQYPVGKQVTVHYMPGKPDECVLEPGVKFQAWILPIFGSVFALFGGLMAIFLPKAINSPQQPT